MIRCCVCFCVQYTSLEKWDYCKENGGSARIPWQNWEKVSRHKRAHHGCLVLLMHILWVNIKEKKHPTCSDSQRRFATRKIKVECGKAWGLCALGREGVRWAHIYSKARTAWGFHWPDSTGAADLIQNLTSSPPTPTFFANNLHLHVKLPFYLFLAGKTQPDTFI